MSLTESQTDFCAGLSLLYAKNVAGSRFTIEEFLDKDVRDARFRALREQGTQNVTKFSTVKNNKSLWCVARP